MTKFTADQVDRVRGVHFEGPVWDAGRQSLLVTDAYDGLVRAITPGQGDEVIVEAGERLGSFALREGGGLLIAAETGLGFVADDNDRVDWRFPVLRDDPIMCLNDGKCDAHGRFWAGSMSTTRGARTGSLYRFEADGHYEVAVDRVELPNGLDWSPDGCTLYLADSLAGTVLSFPFDVEHGALGPGIVLLRFPEGMLPDGLTVDLDGRIWLAIHGSGTVCAYAPDGSLEHIVEVPTPSATSCAFGGPDLRQLYITTGRNNDPSDEYSGSLFVIEPPAQGTADAKFGG